MSAATSASALERAARVLTAIGLTATFAACAATPRAPTETQRSTGASLEHAPLGRATAANTGAGAPGASASPVPAPATNDAPTAPPPPQPAPAPELRRIAVPGDRPVFVIEGAAEASRPLLYFHGKCGDPQAFQAWASAAYRVGTIISVLGDIPCKSGGRTRWSTHPGRLDGRVRAAVAAVEAALGRRLDAPPILFGYSQGALVAEALAARWPERYPRVVLAAGPRAPRSPRLGELAAILLVAGELDTRHHLSDAAGKLDERGVRARYLELPGARHGQYGPEAETRMSAGLAWLLGLEEL